MTQLDPINDYLRVSYSSMNVFRSCHRKFEFTKLMPRRVRDSDAYAADVGKALHAGYQSYLAYGNEELAFWEFMKVFPYRHEWNQKNDYRNLEAAAVTLQAMLDSVQLGDYELAHIKNPAGKTVPAIEVPFELRFKGITLPDGRGIAFTGYIDAILRNLVNGRFRTVDIKTHRSNLTDSTAKYKFDAQQVPYGIVLEHIQGNPIESFEILYLDCYIDVLEPRVTLYPFVKDKEEINEWLMNRILEFQQIQQFMEMDYFPRTSGGCINFNRPCWFLEPCSSRDKSTIVEWLLLGEEADHRPPDVPWIVAEIDVFGGES